MQANHHCEYIPFHLILLHLYATGRHFYGFPDTISRETYLIGWVYLAGSASNSLAGAGRFPRFDRNWLTCHSC